MLHLSDHLYSKVTSGSEAVAAWILTQPYPQSCTVLDKLQGTFTKEACVFTAQSVMSLIGTPAFRLLLGKLAWCNFKSSTTLKTFF